MPTEHTQADVLILEIERAAMQRAKRLGLTDEASMVDQIGHLEALVRNLSNQVASLRGAVDCQTEHAKTLRGIIAEQSLTITRQRNMLREQSDRIHDLQFSIGCDDDSSATSRFTANDAADAAQWGA